jgi:hypothetical protein
MEHWTRRVCAMALVTVPLALGVVDGESSAARDRSRPLAVAELFFELNDTDGDLGLHANVDSGGWTRLAIEGPRERELLAVLARGALGAQGLTQLSFESTEPPFDEIDPAALFRRFPEGVYEIEATAQDGGEYESRVRLSHVLAAPVVPLVSGLPAAESCDAEPLPEVSAPVAIDWDPVVASHPDIGRPGPVSIARYQFFVEREAIKLSLDLPPGATEFEIPASLTPLPGVYKFEIIARTSAGNNTAVESCFRLVAP